MTEKPRAGEHPAVTLLERFMRDETEPAERRWVVRHLVAGCSRCLAVTSKIWSLGDPPAAPGAGAAAPAGRRGGATTWRMPGGASKTSGSKPRGWRRSCWQARRQTG